MVDIDDSFNLIYKYSPEVIITFNEGILEQLDNNDLSGLPPNTSLYVRDFYSFILEFSNKDIIKIFRSPILCKFKDSDKKIKIFSFEHLKIILQNKIKNNVYQVPNYYSYYSREDKDININEIEKTKIYLERFNYCKLNLIQYN